eukprot:4697452-Pyramimonas_sp.AAC.1
MGCSALTHLDSRFLPRAPLFLGPVRELLAMNFASMTASLPYARVRQAHATAASHSGYRDFRAA